MGWPIQLSTCRMWTLIWVLYCTSFGSFQRAYGDTNVDDANALLAFQDAWSPQGILGWTGNDPCGSKWPQIQCNDSTPQRIISLVVSGLGLNGNIPPDVGLLTALETLDLSYNNLSGTLPSQLGQLKNLANLLLQSNKFTGTIPQELGKLQNLRYLYLNGNFLQGQIPHELGLLKNLYWLDLSGNRLQGPLPYSSDGKNQVNAGLDNLTTTRHFHFNNNSLEGSIPGAICHPNMALIHLLLDSNQMSGSIPDEIGQCINLTILKLDHNELQGAIPTKVSRLVNLTELHFGYNMLTGVVPDLSNLSKMNVLGLSHNSFQDAPLPPWLMQIQSLTDLDMQDAHLVGGLPKSLFALPLLVAVKLDDNFINGTLDLNSSGDQLLFVSLNNNLIRAIDEGSYNHELRLQGNPICNSSTTINPQVCNEAPSVATSYQDTNNCSVSCPPTFNANPIDCSCAIPYKCRFTYRAPSFTTLSNTSHLKSFVTFVTGNLNISQNQMEIISATFNSQAQLLIWAWIFPNGSARWAPGDLIRISNTSGRLLPPQFGPPMFEADPYPFELNVTKQKAGLGTGGKIGVAVAVAAAVLIILAVSVYAILQKLRADKAEGLSNPYVSWGSNKGESGDGPKLKGARWLSYTDLKKATDNFSERNEIGAGGYGKVYKGVLLTKEQVAIKRAQQRSMQGAVEFKNEIELLSRVHHKNVVSLVGFCFEQGEQMLVYDYMENGSLREAIFGQSGVRLNWHRRLLIALGAARGIAYLHELASPPIIHRDIKSSNILLDAKLSAKVADFGLSKIGPDVETGKDHVTTQVKGTVGYLDPEYYLTQQLTEKSDVYSYGVVLLEMITARQPIEHGKYIVREVKALLDKGGMSALRSMLDPRILHESMLEVEKFVRIALKCVEESSANRPMMSETVKDFEEILGQDFAEGGSSKMYDIGGHNHKRRPSTSSDHSDYTESSKNSSKNSFFLYSGGYASPPVEPK